MAFGLRLLEARKAAGLTQTALSFPGCSTGYVSRLERGDRVPSLQVIRELALRLGVDENWLAVGATGSETSPEVALRDATLALRFGDHDAAREGFESLRDAPEVLVRARALAGLGQLAFAEDDARLAIGLLSEAVAVESLLNDSAAVETLGRAYARVGEEEEAIGLFRSALERALADEDILARLRFSVLLSNALIDARQFDEAASLLGVVISDLPSTDTLGLARVYWTQSRLHSLRGDVESAVNHARRALALIDSSEDRVYAARAYQMLAHVEIDAGHTDEALVALERGRELFGSDATGHDVATYALEEARLLAELGRPEEAAALAMQSAAGFRDAHPVDVGRSYAELAGTFARLGDVARAKEIYELAIEFLDKSPNRFQREAYAGYGQLLESTGETAEAMTYYKKAAGVKDDAITPERSSSGPAHA